MRHNSGKGEITNNRGNPTLEEHERERGRSGEAIVGEKKSGGTPRLTGPRGGSARR